MKTRIKFCGLVDARDVAAALSLGVDAIGLVFYPRSPRFVDLDTARSLRALLPSFVRLVGLFVNHEQADIARICSRVGIDVLQFHGDETVDECEAACGPLPYWKAVRMRSPSDLVESKAQFASAEALLLDTHSTGFGGSGRPFDWSWVELPGAFRYVMSGGLTASNVGQAIEQIRPLYVDVSSGIQTEDPRRKDPKKMIEFVEQVLTADLLSVRQGLHE